MAHRRQPGFEPRAHHGRRRDNPRCNRKSNHYFLLEHNQHQQSNERRGASNLAEALQISGGSLSIESTSQINNNLILSGGTLTGSGTLTITGLFRWTGGTQRGRGITHANGGLELSGTSTKQFSDSRTLNNAASATWIVGGVSCGANTLFHNLATGSFSATFNGDASWSGGTFTNEGTFTKSVGSGRLTMSAALSNSGDLHVETGTLRLMGSFTQAGGETLVSRGASLDATGLTLNIQAGRFDSLITSRPPLAISSR